MGGSRLGARAFFIFLVAFSYGGAAHTGTGVAQAPEAPTNTGSDFGSGVFLWLDCGTEVQAGKGSGSTSATPLLLEAGYSNDATRAVDVRPLQHQGQGYVQLLRPMWAGLVLCLQPFCRDPMAGMGQHGLGTSGFTTQQTFLGGWQVCGEADAGQEGPFPQAKAAKVGCISKTTATSQRAAAGSRQGYWRSGSRQRQATSGTLHSGYSGSTNRSGACPTLGTDELGKFGDTGGGSALDYDWPYGSIQGGIASGPPRALGRPGDRRTQEQQEGNAQARVCPEYGADGTRASSSCEARFSCPMELLHGHLVQPLGEATPGKERSTTAVRRLRAAVVRATPGSHQRSGEDDHGRARRCAGRDIQLRRRYGKFGAPCGRGNSEGQEAGHAQQSPCQRGPDHPDSTSGAPGGDRPGILLCRQGGTGALSPPAQGQTRGQGDQGEEGRRGQRRSARVAPWQGLVMSLTGLTGPIITLAHSWHTVAQEDDFVHPWLASTFGLRAAYEVCMENCGVFSTLRLDPRERDWTPFSVSLDVSQSCQSVTPSGRADWLHTVPSLFQLAACHMDSQAAVRADAKGVPGLPVSPELGDSRSGMSVCESPTLGCTVDRTVAFAADPTIVQYVPGERLTAVKCYTGTATDCRSCLKHASRASRLSHSEFKGGSLSNLAPLLATPAFPTCEEGEERAPAGLPDSTEAVAILPEHLDVPGARQQVISSFSWFSGFRATGSVAGFSQYDRYALFCVGAHARTRVLERGWSLADIVTDVRRLIPNLRNVRILLTRIANFPPVQVVATSNDTPPPGHAVPLDLRPAGGRIFTTVLFPGMTSGEVEDRISRMCPPSRRPNQEFRLQLPDGIPFRAIPYQVLGPDYIRACAKRSP